MITRRRLYKSIVDRYDRFQLKKINRTEFVMRMPAKDVICGFLFDRTGERNMFRLEVFAQVPVRPVEYLALGFEPKLAILSWDFENGRLWPDVEQMKFEQLQISFSEYIMKVVDDIVLPWIEARSTPEALFLATHRPGGPSSYKINEWSIRNVSNAIVYCYICLAAKKYDDARDLIDEIRLYFLDNPEKIESSATLQQQLNTLKEINSIIDADEAPRTRWIREREAFTFRAFGIE